MIPTYKTVKICFRYELIMLLLIYDTNISVYVINELLIFTHPQIGI